MPAVWVGGLEENIITKNPKNKTIVVSIIAFPLSLSVIDIASVLFIPSFKQSLNLAKKCIESSTAIPKIIVKIIGWKVNEGVKEA